MRVRSCVLSVGTVAGESMEEIFKKSGPTPRMASDPETSNATAGCGGGPVLLEDDPRLVVDAVNSVEEFHELARANGAIGVRRDGAGITFISSLKIGTNGDNWNSIRHRGGHCLVHGFLPLRFLPLPVAVDGLMTPCSYSCAAPIPGRRRAPPTTPSVGKPSRKCTNFELPSAKAYAQ